MPAPTMKTFASATSRRVMRKAHVAAGPKQLSSRCNISYVAPLKRSSVRAVATSATRPVAVYAAKAPDSKKTVVITGTSSGLGLHAMKHLCDAGWHVVAANRDYAKTLIAAQKLGIPREAFTYIQCDLASFESVRKFIDDFRATGRTLDCLVCNAAVYLPVDEEPSFSADGYEMSVAVNHLGHFLLANELLPDLQKSDHKRMVIIGSITGNRNTLAGNIPPQADLGNLEGMQAGFKYPNVMINGGDWEAPKAYKDAKVCNMLTMREMHRRYHDSTGITFSSLYPGCIAETGLFRNHVPLFRTLFPAFQKNITQGYVSEDEAGRRLAGVVMSPDYAESGAYWSWSNDSEAFINTPSEEVQDEAKGIKMWELSERLCGIKAPELSSSPAAASANTTASAVAA